MDPTPVVLILFSAVAHAAWNYAAKNAGDKDSFMLLANLTSQITILPVFIILLKNWNLPIQVILFIAVSAVAEAIYFVSLAEAYEEGDLSFVYPVARSSPLFVAIVASLFLGESITINGWVGIAVILLGVYLLHIKGFRSNQLIEPILKLGTRASRFAIVAALATTIYSLTDKLGVGTIDPILYAFWLEIAISLVLFPVVYSRRGFKSLKTEWRKSSVSSTISGALMRGGYILVLIAMGLAPIGYILALRQVSVVVGAFLGVVLLGEGYGVPRFAGSVCIFCGAYVLAVLA